MQSKHFLQQLYWCQKYCYDNKKTSSGSLTGTNTFRLIAHQVGTLLLDYRDTLNRRWSQWQNVILFRCSTTGLSRHSEQKMITKAECHSVQVLYYWTIETLWTEDDHNGRMSFCSSALLLDYRDTLNRRWSQRQNVILFKCSTTGQSRHSEQKMITMAECHSVQVLYYWTIETLWTEDDHKGRMSFCSGTLLLDYWDTLNRRWSQWQNVILFKCSTTGLSRHWTEDDHKGRMSFCSSALLLDYRDTLNRWSQWQNVYLGAHKLIVSPAGIGNYFKIYFLRGKCKLLFYILKNSTDKI